MDRRINFLDNLRSFIIFLVIAMHAALPYTSIMPVRFNWYLHQHSGNVLLDIIVVALDIFIMPMMFFIAGYFALPSLLKRSPAEFLKSKFSRIILPYIFVVIFLNGYPNYINTITLGHYQNLGYFQYWLSYYLPALPNYLISGNGITFIWFLPLLYVFYCIFILIDSIFHCYIRRNWNHKSPSALFWLTFGLLIVFSFVVIRQFYYDFECWKVFFIFFRVQITRVPIYFLYFFLGVVAYKQQWFKTIIKQSLIRWGIIALLSGGLSIYLTLAYPMQADTQFYLNISQASLHAISVLATFIFLIKLFQQFFNTSSWLMRKINANSYAVYIMHFTYVMLIGYAFLYSQLPVVLLFVISLLGATIASFLTGELILKRVPIIRKWLYIFPSS